MGLKLENLDLENVRELMMEEVESDIQEGRLYISPRLKNEFNNKYMDLLKDSIVNGNDSSLARCIVDENCLKTHTPAKTKSGLRKVPIDAHLTLAEGEFNRYYIRALCRKAIADGKELEIYRAKQVKNPRPESQAILGLQIDPKKHLEDLRANIGANLVSGVPSGPNSGISIRIIEK